MERWQQIESLFQDALERPAAERDAFLRQACGGDADLLREVQSLVANHREGGNSERWAAAAAAQLIAAPDSLQPGQSLGPYQIVSFIAAGGMGSVYRARDPRMGREVAIKVAAERFSERFSREVRAVAALNHPNICHVYDVGPNYLVMELVEGESPQRPAAAGRGSPHRPPDCGRAGRGAREGDRAPRSETGQHQDQAGWHGQGARFRTGEGHRHAVRATVRRIPRPSAWPPRRPG